jgi:hypothetical protein
MFYYIKFIVFFDMTSKSVKTQNTLAEFPIQLVSMKKNMGKINVCTPLC